MRKYKSVFKESSNIPEVFLKDSFVFKNQTVKRVKNLGWLLTHWKEVRNSVDTN